MISPMIMPKVLLGLGNEGKASKLILQLIEKFLERVNATGVRASVCSFSAICGGSFAPSPENVTIAVVNDSKMAAYKLHIDFYETGVHNPVVFGKITPARLAELYKTYKFATNRGDGVVKYSTGLELEKDAEAYFA